MAVLNFNVPLVGQVNANSCWNASAQMLWLYWQGQTKRQGPMNTVQEAYARSKETGIYPVEFIRLAENVGLKSASFTFPLKKDDVASLLQRRGPLWCAGYWWGNKSGHIIVATGINDDIISINDPAPQGKGSKSKKSVGIFNSQLAQNVSGCIMYKDESRY